MTAQNLPARSNSCLNLVTDKGTVVFFAHIQAYSLLLSPPSLTANHIPIDIYDHPVAFHLVTGSRSSYLRHYDSHHATSPPFSLSSIPNRVKRSPSFTCQETSVPQNAPTFSAKNALPLSYHLHPSPTIIVCQLLSQPHSTPTITLSDLQCVQVLILNA